LEVKSQGVVSQAYEVLECAYRLRCADGVSALAITIDASRSAPLINLVLVIENWQGEAESSLRIDKANVAAGANYRIGKRSTLQSEDLIVWIKLDADQPIELALGADAPATNKVPGKAKLTRTRAACRGYYVRSGHSRIAKIIWCGGNSAWH
jgi:hypothetical protein